MGIVLTKAVGVWLIIVIVAILNGILRDKVLFPLWGIHIALPLSGLLLCGWVLVITLLLISFIGKTTGAGYIAIGALWFTLTLSFEFLFGYLVIGKSLSEIIQVFNLFEGNFFLLSLVTSALAPWFSAKLKGYI